MARLNRTHDADRPMPLCLDPQSSQVEDDDFNVLDEGILDRNTPAMSPTSEHRRESLADNGAAFSRSDVAWPNYQYGAEQVALHQPTNAAHGFVPHDGNAFSNPSTAMSVQYSQAPSWPLNGTSGSCTPTADYDGLVPGFDNGRAAAYTIGPGSHLSQADAYGGLHLHTAPTFSSSANFSGSPQSTKEWFSSSSEGQDLRSAGPHISPHSPTFAANTLLLRRDGIRKKNARFEIPAERNLRTIDLLINQTSDEQEIKELKQQKRLLRNRQAALDSRQRKKQHTERLEEEKKHFNSIISDLEEEVRELRHQEAQWLHEKEGWATSQQRYKEYVDNLVMEKEEMVRCHTIETGELRKKNTILMEQLQRLESTAMSTAPSSTGFSADFSDFDHLTMDSSPWDNFSIANDFSIESDPTPSTSMAVAPKQPRAAVKDDDKAAASGFLLMLLLCGAWVASRGPMVSTNVLPVMPEEMRVASATVLEHIYKDAGIQLQEAPCPNQHSVEAATTSASPRARKTTLSAFEIASLSNPPLDTLHHQLTAPNENQLRDQAFSLTPSQYNQLSSDGSYELKQAPDFRTSRSIQNVLAAVRTAREGSAAEVYTRSLMWDKIPKEVVKDFARMIAEGNVNHQEQWKSEPLS
ncbi:hypothetical protein MMC30_008802 [Trapelia coarctata]|nr:hypothetical protein [Trapelia coarctata]